jgi:acyl-CoA synthetase (AMP-forming)/AMP-acid ligase II
LANVLLAHGIALRRPIDGLAGWESPHEHVGLYLLNGNEYLEGMLGAAKARAAAFNVNYRYVAEELQYLLVDAGATGIVVHSRFAPTLAEVLPELPALRVIIQVPDDSGHDLLPGAVWFDDALAGAGPGHRQVPGQRPGSAAEVQHVQRSGRGQIGEVPEPADVLELQVGRIVQVDVGLRGAVDQQRP